MSHIIGIDLGTTNSTLAFSLEKELKIEQFEIKQRISDTLEAKKGYLPSFYLFPLQSENPCVGWYAQQRGAELPDRLISSAKSWLCHEMVDRKSPFLPLSGFEIKRSPVEVCSAFLSHLRTCWEETFSTAPFNQQKLLITVPASFDPAARELVTEAASMAGFPEVRLMEEPLAALYSWLHTHQDNWRNFLKVNDSVLVIDIGGGTTDFSLISVTESSGDLHLERKAVGNHLLLGGDNIDLALAHLAKEKISTEVDEWQFQSLVHSCRYAKETLLGLNPPDHMEIVVQGRGSRIIGGNLTTTLYKQEVEKVLIDGFFPSLDLTEPLLHPKRSGLAHMGLPYTRDPRITAQLAHFLSHADAALPSAVLFNGGTMKAAAFQKRILELLTFWKKQNVQKLEGADFDFAVSRGAVYYGWAHTHKKGIRVKAATCRSYYIGVEGSTLAIPGVPPSLKKVQLVPFGMEEGSEITLENQKFSLLLDEPAHFRFFSRNSPNSQEFIELHPIETILNAEGEEGTIVVVKLTAKLTELGCLELWCVADNGRKWKLEFNVRTNDKQKRELYE